MLFVYGRVLVLFMLIYFVTCIQTNRSLDTLADIVSENEGKFPEFEELKIEENQLFPPKEINQESPFTRAILQYDSIHPNSQSLWMSARLPV